MPSIPRPTSTWSHNEFHVGLFDYIAVAVALLLFIFYIVSFFRDAKYYARIDPPKKQD